MRARNAVLAAILALGGLGLFPALPKEVLHEAKVLSVPKTKQERSNWCWAACSSAILSFFGKQVRQCVIANYGWDVTSCCPRPAPCNDPNFMYGADGSIQDILRHWCATSVPARNGIVSFAVCRREIDAKRPLLIRYEWPSGDGHFIVLSGYSTGPKGEDKKLFLMDPWTGSYGQFKYDYVVSEPDHHAWTHTLGAIQKNSGQAAWRASNTPAFRNGTREGKPAWDFMFFLDETAGGCGRVVKFYWDFFDSAGAFINRQWNTKEDFTEWFVVQGEGEYILPRVSRAEGDLWAHLGGRLSGSVTLGFIIKCDQGNTLTITRNVPLPAGSGSPAPTEGIGMPAAGAGRKER
jgi:hypothetical protein